MCNLLWQPGDPSTCPLQAQCHIWSPLLCLFTARSIDLQVLEAWSQWGGMGLLAHEQLGQAARLWLRQLADALHAQKASHGGPMVSATASTGLCSCQLAEPISDGTLSRPPVMGKARFLQRLQLSPAATIPSTRAFVCAACWSPYQASFWGSDKHSQLC